MNRSSFIRNIIGAFGLQAIPATWVKQYQKIYLLQCFVRGFQFYNGKTMLPEMQTGAMLELVRERDNLHDANAIALHFNKEKMGYIPRESNEILSRLMDAQVTELHAEITQIETKAAPWENVHVAVYVLKEIQGPFPEDLTNFTQLETPTYYTLKHNSNKDKISRIYFENGENYSSDDFYHDMVENSKTDAVYDLLHGYLNAGQLAEAVENDRFVINRNMLPGELSQNTLTKVFNDAVIRLDEYFDEKGLRMVNAKRLAQLPEQISSFVEIIDKRGNKFIEVILKPANSSGV